jgi:hypothetical protein
VRAYIGKDYARCGAFIARSNAPVRQDPLTPDPSPPEGARGERNKDCHLTAGKAAQNEGAPLQSALFNPV